MWMVVRAVVNGNWSCSMIRFDDKGSCGGVERDRIVH